MGEGAESEPLVDTPVDVDNVLESREAQETETLDEPAKPEVKKPARKSKVVSKKSKAPAKKQPKTLGAPKKKPRSKSLGTKSLDELSRPKVVKQQSLEAPKKPRRKSRGRSLEELDEESTRLVKKIERMNSRKDEVIATK